MGTSSTGTSDPTRDTGTNDRRISQRHNVVDSHLVTVDLAFQSGALLLDLSDLGMGVQALSSAPIGTMTTVQFDLPETGGRVDGVGRITWTDTSGRLGIRFEEIAELSRVHLAQWLARDRRPGAASIPNSAMPSWPALYARDEIAALRRDLTTEKLEGDAALAFVVERIRNVTRATGAAIALEDGGAFVCRATSGNAPGVGARLDPNSGLSGDCIRTGEIVRCEDTETDPRADRLVCRKLELRSIVIVPIRIQGRPAGVLEAFSSRAHAFQSSDVLLLRRLSDLVAGITIRQPDAHAASITGPQALMAATSIQPLIPESPAGAEFPLIAHQESPVIEEEESPLLAMSDILELGEEVAQEAPEEPAPPLPSPVVMKAEPRPEPVKAERVAPPPAVAPPAVAPPTIQRRAPLPTESQVAAEPAPPPPTAVMPAIERPAPRPTVVERSAPAPPSEPSAPVAKVAVERAAPPVPLVERHAVPPAMATHVEAPTAQPIRFDKHSQPARTSPLASDIAVPPPAPTATIRTMATAASASASVRTWPVPADLQYQPDAEAADSPGDNLLTSLAPLPKPWRLRITGAGILAAVLIVGGWQVWRAVAPPKGTPMDSEVAKPQATNTAPPAVVGTGEPPLSVLPASAVPPVIPAPSTRTRATSTRPANPPAAKNPAAQNPPVQNVVPAPTNANPPIEITRAAVPEAPPAIGFAHPSGPSAISNVLAGPVAAPKLDRPAVSEMTGGKLIKRFDPVYPSAAAGLHGEVVLKAMINKQGQVSRVQIVKGQALLAQSAAAAVKRWRYEPFRLNGIPIEIENTIVVNFKAPGQ